MFVNEHQIIVQIQILFRLGILKNFIQKKNKNITTVHKCEKGLLIFFNVYLR